MTGTDTGVGKTVLAAAITATLRARGLDAIGLKPILTGLQEPPDPVWPRDHEMLAQVSGTTADQVNAVGYRPPVSPHLAAELAGRPIDPAVIVDAVLAAGQRHQAMIVEGVGGLLVPLAEDYLVRDLAAALSLPVVIAARASLGTINHTLMTLEAARHHALPVAGVVLTPWPDRPEAIHRSNRETIERLGAVEVWGLPTVSRPDPELLGRAAAELPLERWLGLSDRTEV